MKKNFLFISCEEASYICDKAQYGEATLWERFKLKLRLSWCNISRNYSRNNAKLTETISKAYIKCLKDEERQEILKLFEQELAKNK